MWLQAYLSLNEVYPAVQAASKAVELSPLWWPAYQSLGRAHLGLGEVRLVVYYRPIIVIVNTSFVLPVISYHQCVGKIHLASIWKLYQ